MPGVPVHGYFWHMFFRGKSKSLLNRRAYIDHTEIHIRVHMTSFILLVKIAVLRLAFAQCILGQLARGYVLNDPIDVVQFIIIKDRPPSLNKEPGGPVLMGYPVLYRKTRLS